MNSAPRSLFKAAKLALAFLWIFTGLTSLFFSPELGYELLNSVSITGLKASMLVYSGALLDIGIGLWLLSSWKVRYCCLAQCLTITIYTLLLTLIDASFWLHPFGPLTKNIPILMLILIVFTNEVPQKNH